MDMFAKFLMIVRAVSVDRSSNALSSKIWSKHSFCGKTDFANAEVDGVLPVPSGPYRRMRRKFLFPPTC